MTSVVATAIRPCDQRNESSRRRKSICGAPASFFNVREKKNECGLHRQPGSIAGVGTPWYESAIYDCDTPGHAGRPVRRIVGTQRMCFECSQDHALAELRSLKAAEAAGELVAWA